MNRLRIVNCGGQWSRKAIANEPVTRTRNHHGIVKEATTVEFETLKPK